jgi:hypothetical protein
MILTFKTSPVSIKTSQQILQMRLFKLSGTARQTKQIAKMLCSDPKTKLPICVLTHLFARIIVAELLGEAAALLAMDSRAMAVDRSSTITANHVDHLGARVEGQNDPKEQDTRASGPRACSVGVGRGLAAVLGRWSCG